MDPDVDVARQLVYAFDDAVERCDADAQEYAAQQLDEFIDEADDGTPDEVLVALLDLPLGADTLPLLNEVSVKLRRRGPAVVETLLAAALGEAPPELSASDVVLVAGAVGALLELATSAPGVPARTENAVSVLNAMPQGDLILGLIEVLEGPGDRRLKKTASRALVDIGEPAVERLQMSLRDRDAKPWVVDTLVDIRDRHGQSDVDDGAGNEVDDEELGDQDEPDDDVVGYDDAADTEDETGDEADTEDETGDEADTEDETGDGDAGDQGLDRGLGDGGEDVGSGSRPAAAAGDAAPGDPAASPGAPAALPDAGAIDRGYEAFLSRFKRETGQR